jgi:hypothetical protein
MAEASMMTWALPVEVEFRTATADARWSLRFMLSGNEAIHLIPAIGGSDPRNAGNAMILFFGSFGKRRKTERGRDVLPMVWVR